MNNTIRLIKSFAGYPEGEYKARGDIFYIDVLDPTLCEYRIHKDIVEGMSSYFEEVKEQANGRRIQYGMTYYFVNSYGELIVNTETRGGVSDNRYKFGNYYKTEQAAQAVADLRKHVYKFPVCEEGDEIWGYDFRTDCRIPFICGHNSYRPISMPISSSEEDRAKRLRLIENCIREVGYLTI